MFLGLLLLRSLSFSHIVTKWKRSILELTHFQVLVSHGRLSGGRNNLENPGDYHGAEKAGNDR